jgi:LPS export ABC transporter protein LptC
MRAVFIALVISVFISACGRQSANNEKADSLQQAVKVIISRSENGLAQWTLYADEADFHQDAPSYAVLRNPRIIFKKDGKDDNNIKSERGRYDMDRQIVIMSGKVVGVSAAENAKIETEEIFYDMREKKIWSDRDVVLTRGGVIVKGKGLKASSDFSEIEIFKQQTKLPKNIEEFKAGTAELTGKL